MLISASQIERWVETNNRTAQEYIPFLIGQLCHSCENVRRLDFPSGDSISKPGFDGFISADGDAWVPQGESIWEIGTNKDINSKAKSDFDKRTGSVAQETRAKTVFVFVTPRKWPGKKAWVDKRKREDNSWLDIRAYDADDLAQWLEQRPVVKIMLIEQIEPSSRHVQSVKEFWQRWASGCKPAITIEAFLLGRNQVAKGLLDKLQAASFSERVFIPVVADSMEEATAFAAAIILGDSQSYLKALVITGREGWRYIETITQPVVVIASYEYEVSELPVKDNLIIIVPKSSSMPTQDHEESIKIPRPEIYDYQKALVSLGLSEADGRRVALNTGRSWVVFRRHNPIDSRVNHPTWAVTPQALSTLPLMCLAGAWDAKRYNGEWYYEDVNVVSEIAGLPYADIERDLNFLMVQNDSPLLFLNSIWKVKSPLELFFFFADKLTTDQLDRFFQAVEEILSLADPQFELEPEERWKAHSFGKVRPHSPEFRKAIGDSLIKLAVLGPNVAILKQRSIENRVRRLVHNLLNEAEPIRWLSLHSILSALAEAAPDEFLTAVDKSLSLENQPVAELMRQSHSRGITGSCYHADLLWALEILAWDPSYVSKVTKILARLSLIESNSRWGNTPEESLYKIFCIWMPQTTSPPSDRLDMLRTYSKEFPDIVFNLLCSMLLSSHHTLTPSPKQKWRSADKKYERPNDLEIYEMQKSLLELLLEMSSININFIKKLLDSVSFLHFPNMFDKIISLMKSIHTNSSNQDKTEINSILRRKIGSLERLKKHEKQIPHGIIEELNYLLDLFTPNDIILEHKWLFDAWSPPIQGIDELDWERTNLLAYELRQEALKKIIIDQDLSILSRLIHECKEPGTVGSALNAIMEKLDLDGWLAVLIPDIKNDTQITKFIEGFLRNGTKDSLHQTFQYLIGIGVTNAWDSSTFVSLFLAAPQCKEIWDILDSMSQEIHDCYWSSVIPNPLQDRDSMFEYFITKMIAARRPRTAWNSLTHFLSTLPIIKLFNLLVVALNNVEDEPIQMEPYRWVKIIERFENEKSIARDELLKIEFQVFDTVKFEERNPCSTLFKKYTSDPRFFLQMIDAAYKFDDPERLEESPYPDHVRETCGSIVWRCKVLPGQKQDGSIDIEEFRKFIKEIHSLCKDLGKTTGCSIALGYMLVHAPEHTDGSWPPPYICEVLEQEGQEVLLRQFSCETRNLRGIHSRSYGEGGEQERTIAEQFRARQATLRTSFPNVSMMMGEIAASYEDDASREDQEAQLRLEGF